jgi:hypothetical protein
MQTVYQIIKEASIACIISEQWADGSFVSKSMPFGSSEAGVKTGMQTVFFSSLILDSISITAEDSRVRVIMDHAIQFLLTQKSDTWSFNYWSRLSRAAQSLPYPDDLDDTFCSLAALHLSAPHLLTPDSMVRIMQLLIATETAPGGPYRTWLTSRPEPVWNDVDVVVNANIAYFCRLQGITLPPLLQYLKSSIENKSFTSPYYPTSLPVLYYLARVFEGADQSITDLIIQALHIEPKNTLLDHALATCALLRLGAVPQAVAASIDEMSRMIQARGFSADPFCFDPSDKGVSYVAGCPSFTAAVCLEAVERFHGALDNQDEVPQQQINKPATGGVYDEVVHQVMTICDQYPEDLKVLAHRYVRRMIEKDKDKQIILMPYWFVPQSGMELQNRELLNQLSAASLFGWVAYTIYDHIVDGESGNFSSLFLANTFLRELTAIYNQIFVKHPEGRALFSSVMNEMESACVWESDKCHMHIQEGIVTIPDTLPNFAGYEQLAQKSLGHVLAPATALLFLDKNADVPTVISALRHFLIARQLHDDAHDWQEDLLSAKYTSATTLLLSGYIGRRIEVGSLTTEIQVDYWQRVIPELAGLIIEHADQASFELAKCNLPYYDYIVQTLINPLREGAQMAQSTSADTIAFLASYES